MELAQSLLVVPVPNINESVGAAGGKSIVLPKAIGVLQYRKDSIDGNSEKGAQVQQEQSLSFDLFKAFDQCESMKFAFKIFVNVQSPEC